MILDFGNEKNRDEYVPSQTETSEEDVENLKNGTFKKILSYINKFGRRIRHSCATLCDTSMTSALLDSIYYRILSCPVKVAAVFLLSFSIVALIISGLISGGNIPAFLLNVNTYEQIIVFIVSLVLMTSGKKIGELLSGSRILSGLSIVYSQSGILAANSVSETAVAGYSTAFFVGILTGLSSFLHPVSDVILFIISLLCVIFIFNRPECGYLMILFILPLFSTNSVIAFSVITFAALVYKYIRGKRHINFGAAEVLLIISAVFMFIKSRYTVSGIVSYDTAFKFLIITLVSITTVNLVRSTSMLNKFIKLIIGISRLYAIIILIYYIMCVVFRRPAVDAYISNTLFSGLYESLTDANFIASMAVLVCPMNLALAFGAARTSQRIRAVIYTAVLFMTSILVADYGCTLILVVSCIVVLSFFYNRFIMLVILSPLLTSIIMNTYNLIPDSFIVTAYPNLTVSNVSDYKDAVSEAIKQNLLTGAGFGAKNMSLVLNTSSDTLLNSTAISLLVCTGLVGLLMILSAIVIMLFKCGKSIGETHSISLKAKSMSVGLFSSSLSFVLLSIVNNTFLNMRTMILFVIIISLGCTTKRCFDADYIEPGKVR